MAHMLEPKALSLSGGDAQLVYIAADVHRNGACSPRANVLLERPPEAGYVLFIGIRARNIDPCEGTAEGRLLDPGSGADVAIGHAPRVVSDFIPNGDGWASPEPSQHPRLSEPGHLSRRQAGAARCSRRRWCRPANTQMRGFRPTACAPAPQVIDLVIALELLCTVWECGRRRNGTRLSSAPARRECWSPIG